MNLFEAGRPRRSGTRPAACTVSALASITATRLDLGPATARASDGLIFLNRSMAPAGSPFSEFRRGRLIGDN